jgi:saccharopine dehydrogenase-like NADP-dependent oxidoreductase
VIEAGVDVVDITFFEEDAFGLDAEAKAKGVCAIVDAGVAPGLTNVLAGHHAAGWDRLDRFVCGVGGLPVVRTQPWEYKAAFSPVDVLEIYTRPARIVEGGQVVARPALAEIAPYEFPGVGTVDAFVTDGLRSLLTTVACPEMKELTLRYPGHAARMKVLRDAGFLSAEPVEVGDARVAPVELTGKLLFPIWQYAPGEEDMTLFFCDAEGVKDGAPVSARWRMLDRFDTVNGVSSMARTTGYTATATLRLLAAGTFRQTGIVPPEAIGRDAKACAELFGHLARRGVKLEQV